MIHAFFSDPHFGHKQIITYCERPFYDVLHQTSSLVTRYNEVVGKTDFVLWVGDCFLSMDETKCNQLMDRLNGYKALVIGNHDRSKSWMCRVGFVFVVDRLHLHMAGRQVLVCHYPYADTKRRNGVVDMRYLDRRPTRHKGEVLIHGHTHSARKREGNQIHVGIDAWDYAPALYADVEALVAEV